MNRNFSLTLGLRFVLLALLAQSAAGLAANDEVKIDPSIFGGLRARAIGPAVMSGRITSIDVVLADKNIIYVGTAGGGVWKSVNGGTTFEPIFDDHILSIGDLTIDQSSPDTVWVGSGETNVRNSVSVGNGLYKSTDAGKSWENMGLEESERISTVLINPNDSETVYVCAMGHLWNANDQRGVYKTSDGGKSWKLVLKVDQDTGCASLDMDRQNSQIIYAGMWQFRRQPHTFSSGGPGSNLYRSVNGGDSWEVMSKGLPEGDLGRITVAVAPSRPSVVYAVVESTDKTALYRSQNLGETWKEMSSSGSVASRPFYFGHLIVDPKDFDRVYKPAQSLGISSDGGKSFGGGGFGGGVHSDHHALWIDPDDTRHLLLGTDGGVYESRDRGGTWLFYKNLPVSQFYRVSYDMKSPYNVYGGLQDNGSWQGPSRSRGGIANRDWTNVGGGDGFYVLPDPTDDNIVYFESQGGNVVRRHRDTNEAKQIRPQAREGEEEYRFHWNTPIAFSPTRPEVIYIGSQYLSRSNDRGESWQTISGDLTTDDPEKQKQFESGGLTIDDSTAENHCTIYAISESAMDPNVIWVGTDDGNLQVTSDDGKSWTNVVANITGLPENTWVSDVQASAHDRSTAYAVFDGHRNGDKSTYVFVTNDLGKTWRSLATADIDGYAHDICEDPKQANLLFLGTEQGLFVTLDGGRQWMRFGGGLPNVAVREIKIHRRDADVILATHGRGIYIIDDITPLRQITPEILASPMALLETRATKLTMGGGGFGRSNGSDQFVGENPSEVVTISYFLKKRHIFGDLTLEIFDDKGELIATPPTGKRRGINRVDWPMRLKPPRTAPSQTLQFGALFGPMVNPGVYTARLTKNKDVLETQITVKHDPKYTHSDDDREVQREAVWKLYGMQERLAYLAQASAEVRDEAKKRWQEVTKDKKLASQIDALVESLEKYRNTLVVSERRRGITRDERLRERVVSLFGAVNGYAGRPTQTQLDKLKELEKQLQDADLSFEELASGDLKELNKKLSAKKLSTLKILTEEEFKKKDS